MFPSYKDILKKLFFYKGFVPLMEIGSTQPSSMVSDFKPEHDVISGSYEMKWTSSIDDQDVYNALEKEFYPFKRVCFFFF